MRIFMHKFYEDSKGNAVSPEIGDIRITHTKLPRKIAGYAGFVLVLVWDGSYWARLRKQDTPNIEGSFNSQRDSRKILEAYFEYFKEKASHVTSFDFRYWWYHGKYYAKIMK